MRGPLNTVFELLWGWGFNTPSCQPLSRVPEEDPRGHVQPPPPHCVKCSVLRKLTDISPKNDACDC